MSSNRLPPFLPFDESETYIVHVYMNVLYEVKSIEILVTRERVENNHK